MVPNPGAGLAAKADVSLLGQAKLLARASEPSTLPARLNLQPPNPSSGAMAMSLIAIRLSSLLAIHPPVGCERIFLCFLCF